MYRWMPAIAVGLSDEQISDHVYIDVDVPINVRCKNPISQQASCSPYSYNVNRHISHTICSMNI